MGKLILSVCHAARLVPEQIGAVGVGVPGPFDQATGQTIFLPNLAGMWRGVQVREQLRRAHEPTDQATLRLAELELWGEFPSGEELAAGLVDVKNYYIETPEDVAERIRAALRYVAPDKLSITPDCGFSPTARWAARAKLVSMVAGARIVRRELTG
jgi:methionine synthase II (cobalamin-independent)